MFDYLLTDTQDEPLSLARCLFFDHGHELAEAAAMLGGAASEAKVVSCALKLGEAGKITPQILRDLQSLYRLLSLERVGDPDCLETALFAEMNPASWKIDMICLLTDKLADILHAISASNSPQEGNAMGGHVSVA